MQFLFIPTALVNSAQTGRPHRTIWVAVAADNTRHTWKLDSFEPIGIDNFIDWLNAISDKHGCPLKVKHRSDYRPLVSGTVQLKDSKEVK